MTQDEGHRMPPREVHIGDVDELLHHHTELPQTSFNQTLDRALILIGKGVSFVWLLVVGVIIWSVVSRYAFGRGSVTLGEWVWHLAGAAWLIGLGYTLTMDDHVRVDVLHERFSLKTQAWIELLGILLLLLPFLGFAIYEAIPFAHSSFVQGERSGAPAGLGNRWIVKAIMALAFVLLAIAAISRLMRVTALLFGIPTPIRARRGEGV